MSTSREPNERQKEVLRVYSVLAGNHDVQLHNTSNKPVLIHELVAFANGLSGARDREISERLGRDLTLRLQYRDLLKTLLVDSFAKPRAAHSAGLLEKRIGINGVVLKLKAAKAQVGQYYLIIEIPNHIDKPADQPVVLNVFTRDKSERLVFPALHDRRTQLIISQSDLVFALLQDHDLEIDIQ